LLSRSGNAGRIGSRVVPPDPCRYLFADADFSSVTALFWRIVPHGKILDTNRETRCNKPGDLSVCLVVFRRQYLHQIRRTYFRPTLLHVRFATMWGLQECATALYLAIQMLLLKPPGLISTLKE